MTQREKFATACAVAWAVFVLSAYLVSGQEQQPTCGQWTDTSYNLAHRGCEPLVGETWVVGSTFCQYTAYVLSVWRDYLYDEVSVTTSDKQFNRSVGVYGCVLSNDGVWSRE